MACRPSHPRSVGATSARSSSTNSANSRPSPRVSRREVALEPHVGSVVCTASRALEAKAAVAGDAFGINLDISHFAVQGIPTAQAVDALGTLAIVCEVKDQTGVAPDFKFLIPGEGDFDYVDFIRRMAGAGYDGSISVEISVLRQRLPDYDPYAAARQSYEVLSKAFEAADVERSKAKP